MKKPGTGGSIKKTTRLVKPVLVKGDKVTCLDSRQCRFDDNNPSCMVALVTTPIPLLFEFLVETKSAPLLSLTVAFGGEGVERRRWWVTTLVTPWLKRELERDAQTGMESKNDQITF